MGLLQVTPPEGIGWLKLRSPSAHINLDNQLLCLGEKVASERHHLNKVEAYTYVALEVYNVGIIHFFNKHLLSTCCMSGTILDYYAKMNKTASDDCGEYGICPFWDSQVVVKRGSTQAMDPQR